MEKEKYREASEPLPETRSRTSGASPCFLRSFPDISRVRSDILSSHIDFRLTSTTVVAGGVTAGTATEKFVTDGNGAQQRDGRLFSQ